MTYSTRHDPSMLFRNLTVAVAALVLAACVGRAPSDPVAAFDAAIDDLSRGYFSHLPEVATYVGAPQDMAPGALESLNDRSSAGNRARVAKFEELFAALQGTQVHGLDSGRRNLRASLVTLLGGALGPARVASYGSAFSYSDARFLPYPINQMSGPAVEIPWLMDAQQSVRNGGEADTYIRRLGKIAGILDGVVEKARYDASLGVIPPDFIIDKTLIVVDAFAATAANENILYTSFVGKLRQADVAGASAFAARALAIVNNEVLPAYRRISDYLRETRRKASHDAGLWRLPNGDALYEAMIRQMTDSVLAVEDVHQLGLEEVARITAEMDVLLRAEGYEVGTVGERMAMLATDKRFRYENSDAGRAQVLADIEEQVAAARAALPSWFGDLPKYGIEVRAVPEFSQDSATTGYYDSPAPDGSRPGIYWINLRDPAALPKFSLPTLTYHEAIPGHHMQAAISVGREQPLIAKVFWSNPTGEGWALYAEALAAEMGLYADDPAADLGRLQDEIHRAIRLVVDTGIHALKWSREEAIDYMIDKEGIPYAEAAAEIDRYVVWPAQALSYKIGMLKIQELRRDAQEAFGSAFDIRHFHDRLLMLSPAALPVVERDIRDWISTAGEGAVPTTP